ncbi:hypothetical protein [Syntrophorhabdus aromaticivorans]|uniref:hypothetical protein n=1 Tax=Syntrophorhabdus aromaticivorans TaxID=328301 RepID=UPI00048E4D4E|nr:hypothetical protein [Syntrophorhabdus aromaticivorans]
MKNPIIYEHIERESKRLAQEFHAYHNHVEIEYQRTMRRINDPRPKEIKAPQPWAIDRKFNPFYVLKHLSPISKSVQKKLDSGAYVPQKPYIYTVSAKGKVRNTTVYQIPDEAVSNYLYHRLLSKNRHRFSSFSYAYRDDRNVQYAIQDISIELKKNPRIIVDPSVKTILSQS